MTQDNKTDVIGKWLPKFPYVLILVYLFNFCVTFRTANNWAEFGDSFGPTNAFFSGSALFFLIWAVNLQRQELKEVKGERKETKEILKGQQQLTETQKVALEFQQKEQSFYNLVSALSNTIQQLDRPMPQHGGQIVRAVTRQHSQTILLTGPANLNGDILGGAMSVAKLFGTLGIFIEGKFGETHEDRSTYYDVVSSLLDDDIIIIIAAIIIQRGEYKSPIRDAFIAANLRQTLPDVHCTALERYDL